jgi:hypothetical protein
MARAAGGADVCGFARAYEGLESLCETYPGAHHHGWTRKEQSNIRPVEVARKTGRPSGRRRPGNVERWAPNPSGLGAQPERRAAEDVVL